MTADFNRIKEFYRRNTLSIYEGGKSRWGIDPYAWDHEAGITLTLIEQWLWHDIRGANAIMYPQYPVAGYFVDFGNPVARVAIECDGHAYHLDKQRDAKRQRAIEANGWTVYRFTGRECMEESHDGFDEDGNVIWITSQTEARIREIVERHGIAYQGGSKGSMPRRLSEVLADGWLDRLIAQYERANGKLPPQAAINNLKAAVWRDGILCSEAAA